MPTNVRGLIDHRAEAQPDADYLIAPETGRWLSFADLQRRSRSLAALLSTRGIAPGAHVGLLLPNGLQAVRLFLGTMASGRVVVPLSLIAQPAQLSYVVEHADCVAVFVAREFEVRLRQSLSALAREIEIIVVDPDQAAVEGEAEVPAWNDPEPQADAPALLMYTSGTTGRPKGVVLTHGNVLAGARYVSEAHALGVADRVLAVLPLYHINAQIVTVLAPLQHGGSLVMPHRFSSRAFWALADEHRCTWLNVVPTIIAYLLDEAGNALPTRERNCLRFCRSASAPLPPAHHRAFEDRFGIGIIETMGLTETAAPVFTNPLDPALRRIGSPGQAFGNEAKVLDPTSGRDLATGEAGEIVIRGANVMAGYYKAPEETALAFTSDGWLRTGDLGYRDAEGFYFITGRLKELIIKGGENIAPREIDEVLLQHPAVLEAAAVGVPDEYYGQEILAGIMLRPGEHCSEAALRDFCRERLGSFKVPRYLVFLPELPKGPSGKVQRRRLLESMPPVQGRR